MQKDLLKSVVSSFVGQSAAGVVDLLFGKKNINEFLISKKLKMTINQARNILYKLADEGIVSFIRKKDRKKGGWYIYFWTLNTGKGLVKFKEHLTKRIDELRKQLELRKTARFFHCPSCNLEFNEETALLYQYTCPECGEILQIKEKVKEIENLEKELAKLEQTLVAVSAEIGEIERKEESTKMRKLKAEMKKKAKERALKKKKKERELMKLKKKKTKGKKPFKKKFKKFFRELKKRKQ
ncbi:MAG: hypothetical protein QXD13_00925 [Candidatus Pacearchaeota archaeon]